MPSILSRLLRTRLAGAGKPFILALSMMSLSGCVLTPQGTEEEQAKLALASLPYEPPIDARRLPAMPARAERRDVLSRAFLANGELESAYFEWKAALARIGQAATWPNSNIALTYSYMFSPDKVKLWNRSTIGVGFDPSMSLSLPIKARTAGKMALEAAKQAGEKFRAAKFELQRRVLSEYLDLALNEEKIRIERYNLTVLRLLSDSASYRAQAGGPMQDLLKALIESQLAENRLSNLQADAAARRATLNGMLARDGKAPLALPPVLPSRRTVAVDDARLIAMAVDQNPELVGLARQVAGRTDAIELARLAYLPDFGPSVSITGNISQVLGSMVMLPTKLPAIRAAINEAEAMERSAEAILRQTKRDRAASFVANLYFMRNAERQTAFYQQRVVPAAEQLLSTSRQEYAAGTVGFADLIDSERMFIEVRLVVADARIEREKRLAELEALAGTDLETLGQQTLPGAQAPTMPVR